MDSASSRARRTAPAFSREEITRAAIVLADSGGLGVVSMIAWGVAGHVPAAPLVQPTRHPSGAAAGHPAVRGHRPGVADRLVARDREPARWLRTAAASGAGRPAGDPAPDRDCRPG